MAEPECPQKFPYVCEVAAGRHAWCACGRSASQPYCDGSHAGSEFRPQVVEIDEARKVAWCGCRQTGNPPFCDGSHASLPADPPAQ